MPAEKDNEMEPAIGSEEWRQKTVTLTLGSLTDAMLGARFLPRPSVPLAEAQRAIEIGWEECWRSQQIIADMQP